MSRKNIVMPNTVTKYPNGTVRSTTSDNGGKLPVLIREDMPVGHESDYTTKAPQGVPNVVVGTAELAGRK